MKIFRIQRHDVVFVLLAAALVMMAVHMGAMVHHNTSPSNEAQAEIARRVERARRGQKMVLPLPGRLGNIYARSRHSQVLLAGSRQVPGCFVDPKLLTDRQLGELSSQLGEIFDDDPGKIAQKLALRRRGRFVWIRRRITPEQVAAVGELRNRAVGIRYEWIREYPNGRIAGTVIGFCRKDGQPGSGLELTVRDVLSPVDGKRVVLGDARRRPIWSVPDLSVRPTDGRSIYLSLDVVLQGYLQQAVSEAVRNVDAKWGTGIIVNPWTGEILAMCSVPTYDPNLFNQTPAEQMLNRAISCPFEPGSVFKPIIAAAAVQAGVASYDTPIYCENGVYHARRGGRITDHGKHFGSMSLWDVVVLSSNIGMAKVGEKMGNRRLWESVRRWGFARRTGVSLPGETPGIVRKLEQWDGYSTRRVPFGQEISTSGLQLVMAFSAIANGGVLMSPSLIQQIADARGQVVWSSKPKVVRRVLSRDVARQTLSVLQDVVERGTGTKARLRYWSSFGKTGTAQIAGPGGYVDGAYVGTFIGGAPVERPVAVCLISIYWPDRNKGYYGGTVAAPFVREVLEKTMIYLNVPPDRPDGLVAATTRW